MTAISRHVGIVGPLAKNVKRALYHDCDTATIYGKVMQTTHLEYNGHRIEVDYIEPRALLRFLVEGSPKFGEFLLQRLQNGQSQETLPDPHTVGPLRQCIGCLQNGPNTFGAKLKVGLHSCTSVSQI